MQDTSKPTTPREYFFTIDAAGHLIHDGAIVDDTRFLERFYRSLRVNDSGRHTDYRYYSPCGSETNYVACVDSPIVFNSLRAAQLYYGAQCSIPFRARDLRYSTKTGVLYHAAPVGELGRLLPKIAVELAATIEKWGPWYAFRDSENDVLEVIEPVEPQAGLRLLRPKDGNLCVGCGRDSSNGLKLSFLFNEAEKSVQSWFVPDNRLMGSLNIMHGGFVALLLDETMGKILGALGIKAPTAQLNVRYRRPVPIAKELHLSATLEQAEGRKHHLRAEIRLAAEPDVLLAEASALFIRLTPNNLPDGLAVNHQSTSSTKQE